MGDDPTGVAFSPPWAPQRRDSSLTDGSAPAVASLGSEVYTAEENGGLIDYEIFDTTNGGWSGATAVPGADSTVAPAVAVVGTTVWVAWTTSLGSVQYNELDTSNGTWEFTPGNTPSVPGADASGGPALADAEGTVYAAWADASTGDIGYESTAGEGWSGSAFVPSATTTAPPAIAAPSGSSVVYFAWRTSGNGVDLDFLSGTFGTPHTVPGASTNFGPAVAITTTALYVLWKDATTNRLGYSLATAVGFTVPEYVPSALTSARTSLTALGANLFTAFQGRGNTTFWYDALDEPASRPSPRPPRVLYRAAEGAHRFSPRGQTPRACATVSAATLEVMKKLLVIAALLGLGAFAFYKLRSS